MIGRARYVMSCGEPFAHDYGAVGKRIGDESVVLSAQDFLGQFCLHEVPIYTVDDPEVLKSLHNLRAEFQA